MDVQVTGSNLDATRRLCAHPDAPDHAVPGAADVRLQQSSANPQIDFQVDRSRIAQLGLTEQNVTSAVATALAGTSQTAPNFWLNPQNNVSYAIVAQTPEYKMDTMSDLQGLPVTHP